jgi:hypothetical protein
MNRQYPDLLQVREKIPVKSGSEDVAKISSCRGTLSEKYRIRERGNRLEIADTGRIFIWLEMTDAFTRISMP